MKLMMRRGFCFVGIKQLTSTQCMEIASWANEESVLIMAFADDQNVYDFDPLNFKFE